MKKKILFVAGAILLTLTGCGQVPKLKDGKEVVASIDGYELTAEDVYAELKKQYGTSIVINQIDKEITKAEIKDDTNSKTQAENRLKAIKAQYETYKMDFSNALKQAGYDSEEALKESMMIDFQKDEVLLNYVKENLTKEEIQDYYDKNISGEMTVRHILIKPQVTSDMTTEEVAEAEAKAQEKAISLINKLNDGADFAELAKENSDDAGTAVEGGLFSNFTKQGTVEGFYDAAAALKDGEYTEKPVKTIYGYHIILRVSANEKPELDTVIDDIKEKLATEKLNSDQTLSVTYWDEIREKHNMKINDSAIKDNYDEIIKSYKK